MDKLTSTQAETLALICRHGVIPNPEPRLWADQQTPPLPHVYRCKKHKIVNGLYPHLLHMVKDHRLTFTQATQELHKHESW